MGFVYLLEFANEDGIIYKIGFTRGSIKKRIEKLQTGNPYEIKELYSFPTKYNQKLEKTIHRYFNHCKLKGEWFSLDIKEVTNFISICEKFENNFDLMKDNYFLNRFS